MKARQAGVAFQRQATAADKGNLRDKIAEGFTRPSIAKRLQGYDSGNPRCSNCKDIVDKGESAKDCLHPRAVNLFCGLGGFIVKAGGCCDLWQGRDGSVLEKP